MSCDNKNLGFVLLYYLIYQTSLEKVIKFEACRAFYRFFATNLINTINMSTHVRFSLYKFATTAAIFGATTSPFNKI